jgi:ATP-dependent Clp protease ATP-binding subunit ClpB
MKEKIDQLNVQSEFSQRKGDYQQSAKIRYDDIPKLETQLQQLMEKMKDNKFIKQYVESEDIAETVSKWTGIPINRILSGEKEKLLHLEDLLSEKVIGQEKAVKSVSDVIRMSKMGVVKEDKPIGSFLFFGNTGVGKTELAKSLARVLFDDEKALVRVDMSEYMEAHSVAKLIGAPPGYVGFEDGGQLTEQIRRRPYSIILFDEMEKAHPAVLNILLQVLDDGRLTDTKGRVVNFKNTILILTSNLKEESFRNVLAPEFINRIDDIIHFNSLGTKEVEKIVHLQLAELEKRMELQDIQLHIEDAVITHITKNGYNPEYGARPIQRIIRKEILAGLSSFLLENPESSTINMTLDNGIIIFQPTTNQAIAA